MSTWFTLTSISLGLMYSLYYFGGITEATQYFELTVMVGFLGGTYLLARGIVWGWIGFIAVNAGMAALMFANAKYVFATQQSLSLFFTIGGLLLSLKSLRDKDDYPEKE